MTMNVEKTYTLVLSEKEAVTLHDALREASAQIEYILENEDLCEETVDKYKEDVNVLDDLYDEMYTVMYNRRLPGGDK